MGKTINFCGDSFCDMSTPEWSWTRLLANHFEAQIQGLGLGGTAHEHAIKSFDSLADYTVFCWTEKSRVYHKSQVINFNTLDHKSVKEPIDKAAYAYYKYLYDEDVALKRQQRDLYWFDHTILTHYQGTVIHLWCFEVTYTFKHGHVIDGVLWDDYRVYPQGTTISNHLNESDNHQLYRKIIGEING